MSGASGIGAPVSQSGKPMNVLFIMTDQWRAQAMGYRKEDPVNTPFLDALARESINFNNGIAASPVCGPNRACWLTGRYMQNHGLYRNEGPTVNPDHLLSRVFKDNGYHNGYIGKWHLSGKQYPRQNPTPEKLKSDYDEWYRVENHTHFNLRYDDNGKMINLGDGWQPDHETDKAIDFISENDGRPFNLVLSFGPPHNGAYSKTLAAEKRYTPGLMNHKKGGYGYYGPIEYEEPYLGTKAEDIRPNIQPIPRSDGSGYDSIDTAIAGYYGACSAIDAAVGRLVQYLKKTGVYDNTIIVFSSDHGEMLGSHGLMTKGVCFEESLNIPLLVRVPGLEARQSDLLFNSTDVVPTLLGLTGQSIPAGVDGADHSKYIFGASSKEPEYAHIGYAQFRGLRSKDYTYVSTVNKSGKMVGREGDYFSAKRNKSTSHILFDLKNDPYQMRPIMLGDGAHTDSVIKDFHGVLIDHLSTFEETVPSLA